jgi:nitrogen-specific signal transduction histidine kinase
MNKPVLLTVDDDPTKPIGQGTGLGLDLVRRLVDRNDGSIEVESEPGRTEFRVTLPVLE